MLARIAEKIFHETLLRVDAREAVRRAVSMNDSLLALTEDNFEIDLSETPLYVVALGKAAFPMAAGFGEIAGKWITKGVISGAALKQKNRAFKKRAFDSRWQIFYGGHPLPNEESLRAARACFEVLDEANARRAAVVFLISGGGSAMIEMPCAADITLSDLREMNRVLVTSGAAIAEINSVRRAVSMVKGGGLARGAPRATQISLIISDTARGDVSSVASGPSLTPEKGIPELMSVLEKYDLRERLPSSVIGIADGQSGLPALKHNPNRRAYVLLDNEKMTHLAASEAEKLGFAVQIDEDDSLIAEGCERLFFRFLDFRRSVPAGRAICLVSGGEFGCKVTGNGIGGRNSETVLRLALLALKKQLPFDYAFLSAGTDGIDGNSPAAGAVACPTLCERAAKRGMNPREYLENSDSFSFFEALGAAVMTGATGTNVRDLRLLVAK